LTRPSSTSSGCSCKYRSVISVHVIAGKRHYHLPALTNQTNRFDAGADDVDGQRHRAAAAGDVPRRRAPVSAADAVHGFAAGGAEPAGCQPPGPPHAGGQHHGAVRALPRRQPPPAHAHPSGPTRRPLLNFFFHIQSTLCRVCVFFLRYLGSIPPRAWDTARWGPRPCSRVQRSTRQYLNS
jgi:hypothetical protein